MRTPILLVAALAIAIGTAFLIRNRLNDAASQTEAMDTSLVLVAANSLDAGHFIRAESDFVWTQWPVENLHESYIQQGTVDITEFEGAVARTDILAGEPIYATRLVKPDDGGFMPAVLHPGMRAISISVNATTGNAGFIFPGDHVDMILTHELQGDDDNNQGFVSETFAKDVRVLAVDQRFNSKDSTVALARTVTLELSPKQAEMTNVATELGRISLSLRSLSKDSAIKVASGTENENVDGDDVNDDYTSVEEVSQMLNLGKGGNNHLAARKVSVSRGSESEQLRF